MSPRIAPVLFVLACRPEQPSTTNAPTASAPATVPSPSPIPAGHGVLVRPGATVWLDAAGTQPLVLPKQLVGDGVQMRVIADHGDKLEVNVETAAACESPVLGDFALRLFVARDGLRDATSLPFEHVLPDGKRVIVQQGAPVDGAAGERFLFVEFEQGGTRVKVSDVGVASHFVVGPADKPCIAVRDNGKPIDLRWGAASTARMHDALTGGGRPRSVVGGARVYWNNGTQAGKVAHQHAFHAEPMIAGTRTCFGLRLAEGNSTTLCFDSDSVIEGTALGSVGLQPKPGGTAFGGRGERVPWVRQGKADVQGKMDKDIVRRIVRSHVNEMQHCYNQALVEENPAAQGRVTVKFTIGATGAVVSAQVAESSMKDTELPQCMADAVKRWKFPKPEDGAEVSVTYPFVLETGS